MERRKRDTYGTGIGIGIGMVKKNFFSGTCLRAFLNNLAIFFSFFFFPHSAGCMKAAMTMATRSRNTKNFFTFMFASRLGLLKLFVVCCRTVDLWFKVHRNGGLNAFWSFTLGEWTVVLERKTVTFGENGKHDMHCATETLFGYQWWVQLRRERGREREEMKIPLGGSSAISAN